MACSRLVGLEKGKRAFLGCFLMSAAGGFVYARARVRASGSVGLSYLLASLENKTKSARILENKTRSVRFRKLNGSLPCSKTVNGFSRSLVGSLSYLKSGKRSRAPSVYTYTRARVGSVLSLSVFSYPKKLFFLFHSFFIYFFLLFLFSVKA